MPIQRKPEYPSPVFLDDDGSIAKLRKHKEAEKPSIELKKMKDIPQLDEAKEFTCGTKLEQPLSHYPSYFLYKSDVGIGETPDQGTVDIDYSGDGFGSLIATDHDPLFEYRNHQFAS